MKNDIIKRPSELSLSQDIIEGEIVIVFPKSQVFSYVYAVSAAKSSDIYAEGVIGKRLHHVACFKSIRDKAKIIQTIVKMLHHTKGIQIIIRGELSDPWTVKDVIDCYVSSLKSPNLHGHCSIVINESGFPCGYNNSTAAAVLPCRLMAGRAYKRLHNSIANFDEIISIIAVEEGVYWCPSLKRHLPLLEK